MSKRTLTILALFFIFLLLVSCKRTENMQNIGDTITIITSHGKIPVKIEIADEELERERGLMERDALEKDAGMLFVFPNEQYLSFWMKKTKIPLDILFIDEDGMIVDVQTMPICIREPCPIFRSAKQGRYALEVNAGFADDHNVALGDKVRFT
ncbi:DUF192 domain-containing protein [Candidatus Woesearchaeota archaeon]|nr:DUF192 domain-containing protein [Candidatus Woesearchaeota archaeon]